MKFYPLFEFLTFSRAERNAAIVLIFFILFCFAFPSIYDALGIRKAKDFRVDFTPIEVENYEFKKPTDQKNLDIKPLEVEEFYFDPNNSTIEEFRRLGLSGRVAQSIENYRKKGGKFFIKEDFAKIYTLSDEDYLRLAPWIRIQTDYAERTSQSGKDFKTRDNKDFSNNENEAVKLDLVSSKSFVIDVNLAYEEEWKKLYGIGAVLASRIVKFREKLGGFTSIDQVSETFGLPDSTFQNIQPHLSISERIRKLNVNSATEAELDAHPYISKFQATALFSYRKMHGPLNNMSDFRKIAAFKEYDWVRLEPYLSFE
jgi:DNA uptake protein ComE-like DNA-binding protein